MADLVIYKDKDKNLNNRGFKIDVSTDPSKEIIWQGESWSDFTNETGFDESHLLGLKVENSNIVFDQDQADNAFKKVLTGEILYKAISIIIGEDWPRSGKNASQIATEIKSVMNSFNENRGLIESQNEITQAEYNAIKNEVVTSLTANPYVATIPGFLNALNTRLSNAIQEYKFKQ